MHLESDPVRDLFFFLAASFPEKYCHDFFLDFLNPLC